MLDFMLKDNKIVFINGLVQYVDGAERVRQQIEFRLSLWRGEWFLDGDFGTPYLQSILGKQLTINGALNAIRSEVLAIDGVTSIDSFEFNFDRESRRLDVAFNANTPFGIIPYP